MSNSLASKVSDLAVTSNHASATKAKSVELNGGAVGVALVLGDSPLAEKPNPWKSRPISVSSSNTFSGGALRQQDSAEPHSTSTEKLFEADAWPEPSAPFERRSMISNSGRPKSLDEKPKSKKPTRKWQNVDIEYPSSRGGNSGRGGVRLPSNSAGGFHQSASSQSNVSQSNCHQSASTLSRGGGGRRGGSSANGPFSRGRGGRPLNGYYPRQILRGTDHDPVQEVEVPQGNNHTESPPKPLPTATVYASGAPRGSYSSRQRRAGVRGGGYSGSGYLMQKSSGGPPPPPLPPSAPTAEAALHQSAAAVAQTMSSLGPVTPVTYLFPNMMMPGSPLITPSAIPIPTIPSGPVPASTEAAVLDGSAAALQAAVLLPEVSSSQVCLASPEATPPAVATTSAEVLSLEQMVDYIDEVGWSKARIPECLRSNPTVAAAMQAAGVVAATGDIAGEISTSVSSNSVAGKKEDVVVVDDKVFFVPRSFSQMITSKHLSFHVNQYVIELSFTPSRDYYFSDANLHRDQHLMSILSENNQSCPLTLLLAFNRLRWVNVTEEELLEAIVSSPSVSVVYSAKGQKPIGVAPQTSSLVRPSDAAFVAKTSVTEDSVKPNEATELHQITEADPAPSIFLPAVTMSNLPILVPPGAPLHSAAGPQPNGNHFFPAPQLLPYPGIPSLPSYYVTAVPPTGMVAAAAGDQTTGLNNITTDNNALYYRAVLAAAAGYPQTAPPHLLSYGVQQPPFYFPLIQPSSTGAVAGPASSNHSLMRNAPSGAFFVSSAASSNPVPPPPTIHQKSHPISVRATLHRPPSNRPISTENKAADDLPAESLP
ncbi:unnamed protein product [Mesocestoides corti]|uniref:HTH La-type RNA-binding domain-containing protein n=1 Tax=Mesocestoides corti TaxID=53468 RepID=A0A0R3UMC7_MESCO|nr:unnamed protein product [Mesocestoides corti]